MRFLGLVPGDVGLGGSDHPEPIPGPSGYVPEPIPGPSGHVHGPEQSGTPDARQPQPEAATGAGDLHDQEPGPSHGGGVTTRSQGRQTTDQSKDPESLFALPEEVFGPQSQFRDQTALHGIASRSQFRSNSKWNVEDHLYTLTLHREGEDSHPRIVKILSPLRIAIERVLLELRDHYANFNPGEESLQLVFVTIVDKSLRSGINSGSFSLTTKPEIITAGLISQLFHFLISQDTLELSDSFAVKFRVLSIDHSSADAQKHYSDWRRRKRIIHNYLLGAPRRSRPFSARPWCLPVPSQLGNQSFECLLIALIVANELLLSFENNATSTLFIESYRVSPSSVERALLAKVAAFKKHWEAVTQSAFSSGGPYRVTDIVPYFCDYAQVQCTIYSDLSNPLAYMYPETHDQMKRQIFLFAQLGTQADRRAEAIGHVDVIQKLQMFYNDMKGACLHCKKPLVKPRDHLCIKAPSEIKSKSESRYRNCFICRRFFYQENQPLNSSNSLLFCRASADMPYKSCPKCNIKYQDSACFELHSKKYCSKSYYCTDCNRFNGKSKGACTRSAIKNNHQHGHRLCRHCHSYDDLSTHQCSVTKQKHQLDWSHLAVIKGVETSSTACRECINFRSAGDSLYCCVHSQADEQARLINHVSLLYESKVRGSFVEEEFSDPALAAVGLASDRASQKKRTTYEYFHRSVVKLDNAKRAAREGSVSQNMRRKEEQLQTFQSRLSSAAAKSDVSPAVLSLLSRIISPEFMNYAFLVHSEAGELDEIAAALVAIDCEPYVCAKDGDIICVDLPKKYQIKFLNFSYFLEDKLHIVAKSFDAEIAYFPMQFNTPCNYAYRGEQPPLEFWQNALESECESESKKRFVVAQSVFLLEENSPWCFYDEIRKYCSTQVHAIAKIATTFVRESFSLQECLIKALQFPRPSFAVERQVESQVYPFLHPFTSFNTLAGFSYGLMKLYALNSVPNFSLMTEFRSGRTQDNCSKMELEYVSWIQHVLGDEIPLRTAYTHQHGQKVIQIGETKIIPDLFYHSGNLTLIGFASSCYYRSHEGCRQDRKHNRNEEKRRQREAGRVYYENQIRLLRNHFNPPPIIIECHECFWNFAKKNNQKLSNFLKFFVRRPRCRLTPRTALRTGLCEMYGLKFCQADEDVDQDRVFQSLDIISAYPAACIENSLPYGRVHVIIKPDDLRQVSFKDGHFTFRGRELVGLGFCAVTCPDYLDMPFLQWRNRKEETFTPLCERCVVEERTEILCGHTDKTRPLRSVWTLAELAYCVGDLGYEIFEWYEIYAFENCGKILSDYFRVLGAEKLKHTGLPSACDDQAKKEAYCVQANDKLGLVSPSLKLTPSNVRHDACRLRTIKSIMVSGLGRLAAKNSDMTTRYLSCPSDLSAIVEDKRLSLENLEVVSNNICRVSLRHLHAKTKPSTSAASIIYSHITAYTRIKLHKALCALRSRNCSILTTNTDSIKFVMHRDLDLSSCLEIGHCPGEWKSDIQGDVTDFVALGPRCFSMQVSNLDGSYTHKVQAHCFSLQSRKVQNLLDHSLFDSMLSAAMHSSEMCVELPQGRKRRRPLKHTEVTLACMTLRNEVSNRRIILPGMIEQFGTLPYGCKVNAPV